VRLADELLSRWAPILRSVDLVSGTKGRFEVTLDGELIFSKAGLQRHANPGEVTAAVERRIGPALDWRQ
jgi:predicted Rdx family selenoprotein